ncbi:MAG TPA: SCO family protein, partial [Verrucomicrobiae bacterium]|nr:SCO family protein [Verrucomicrobiae bacterium]
PDKATFIAGQGPALLGKALSLACFLMAAHAALAQTLPDETLARIRFEQKLDGQVSLDLPFRDEDGRPVRLRQYFGEKPVVLVLGYYQCPMLCTLVLNGMVESAADMKWSIGREFEVLDVSINPEETPALAAAKKRSYVKRYGRSEAAQGWHFLTGNQAAIQQLANEVGFHYAYDPASKQFAHPSGLVILTPQGKVSGYLFGVTFAPKDLYTGLRTATRNQVGSPIQELLLLCFHYNPITGKYSKSVIVVLRVLSAATILGFLGLVVALARRGKGPGTTWQGNDSEPATPAARTQPGTRT